MAVLPIGMSGEAGGYQIQRSLRFNSADSAYLSRTPASAGNRKTWTWSGWVKRSNLSVQQTMWSGGSTSTNRSNFLFQPNGELRFFNYAGSVDTDVITTPVYRDASAYYHLVLAIDTTQATSSNRVKIYVNGSQITALGTATYPSQNTDLVINSAIAHGIGRGEQIGEYFSGYMTEVFFIDGQALTPSSFGEVDETTGVWKPIRYAGTYGTNGFYLPFSDNSSTTALGYDESGNGNNWTPNNFSVTAGAGNDSLVDTPTPYGTDTGAGGEVRGNYATWNPLDKNASISTLNGNLDAYVASGSWFSVRATIGMTSGKWYWECTPNTSAAVLIGIGLPAASLATYVGGDAFGWSYFNNGNKFTNNVATSYGAGYTTNDVIGIAFDADSGTLTFYKNGVSQGTAFTGLTSGPYFPMVGIGGTLTVITNFGQRPFAYTAPSGFKALCTQNLPEPTVVQGDNYFNTVLYTGNGSTNAITGVGFQPDFVWAKDRVQTGGYHHILQDAVRGANKVLYSNLTNAETTASGFSFNSDGFTLGTGIGDLNVNGSAEVAWNWKANGSGVSNTAGTITSTVSANTTSGFSIVTYVGTGVAATIGHGLGATPSMIIVKRRTSGTAQGWQVFHSAISGMKDGYIYLHATNAFASGYSGVWGGVNPTSTVFSVGTDNDTNASGGLGYVAYCFAPVAGFSAFGSYTGNGSTDGTFVYTGFRPRWIMFKRSSTTGYWYIFDTARGSYNILTPELYPNTADAEPSTQRMDILSNGFKCRTTEADINGSGSTMIYAAFAENPFKYSLAR